MSSDPHKSDPHKDAPVLNFGKALTEASGAVILLHGRGGSAEDILSLAHELYFPELAYLAPQAAGNTWYPNSFLAPIEQNEPWLTSALRKVESILRMANDAGISTDRIDLFHCHKSALRPLSRGYHLPAKLVDRNRSSESF